LSLLLRGLDNQRTDELFSYSIVVADNDPMRSAEQIVLMFPASTSLIVRYCFQPQQNIALTRNEALQHADYGELVAFIDDDELPTNDWLYQLFKAHAAYGVAGVLGQVNPRFQFDPPEWVKKGRFFDRPTYASGYHLSWRETRTGNVLFSKHILDGVAKPFDPEFGTGGEDEDFFRRMIEKGYAFVWCHEAPVYEIVPPSRCTRSYLLRRWLLRGSNSKKHPTGRVKTIIKSLVAVPCYIIILPIVLVFG
jgi:succinoglycan biosynthesis protein ExoM